MLDTREEFRNKEDRKRVCGAGELNRLSSTSKAPQLPATGTITNGSGG